MSEITFFDLFSGIGGFRLAFERLGWKCAGWCENDKYCIQTYKANYDTASELFWSDATDLPAEKMPDFDALCAGFPCQSFSVAGKRRGFEDARGTLIYEIFRVLEAKRPRVFLLENVKGLVCKPFRDREFRYIVKMLHDSLGYRVFWKVLNSRNFGVPQNRERVYVVGLRDTASLRREFVFPKGERLRVSLSDVLEEEPDGKYTLSPKTLDCLLRHSERHRKKGHGFGMRVLNMSGASNALVKGGQGRERNLIVANTIPSRYCKNGSENLILARDGCMPSNRVYSVEGVSPTVTTPEGGRHIPQIAVRACLTPDRVKKRQHGRRFKEDGEPMFTLTERDVHGVAIGGTVIRRLTPRECARLQGFPDSFRIPVSDTQAYKQFGNAVTVNVVEAIGRRMEKWLT